VNLFTPYEQSESILGDLLESSLTLLRNRETPWPAAGLAAECENRGASNRHRIPRRAVVDRGTVVGGWLLLSIFVWSTQKAVIAVLYRYQVYAHIDAYVFWLIYAVLSSVSSNRS